MSTELGKYEVLGKLAQTETAELFVARTSGTSTPQKFVVLKRLKRDVAADVARAKAFISRSRLATRIEHHNVAQVIEVGKLGASFYCAMEFVDGESVRAIIEHARGKKIPIPVRVVLAIAAGAAMGLRHAHELKGDGGNVLGIVHGDIATHSVMVSRDGVVKLVGFGIAQDAKTSDRGSDLAGLGSVLWELLTLQPVESGSAPPSSKRLDVPKELDAIVLKLLGKGGQYDYVGEVLAEIEGLAAKLDIAISTQDLARAMRLWFPDAGAGNGEELKPVVVEAEQATGDLAVAAPGGPIDQMLDDVRSNAGAIRSAVAAAVAQPTTRRRASSTAVPLHAASPPAERETFEQIRDRIMANARPKTQTGSAPNTDAPARKKSETLNPGLNQYSYITAVAGKEKEPLRAVTSEKSEPTATQAHGEIAGKPAPKAVVPESADTDKMDAAAKAELEARARAVAEEALRAEQKAKILAEQRARAELLKEQARNRAEHEERAAEKLRAEARAKAIAEAEAALSGSMPAASEPEAAQAEPAKAEQPAATAAAADAAAKAGADDNAAAAKAQAAKAEGDGQAAKAEADDHATAAKAEPADDKAAKADADNKAANKADANDAAAKAKAEADDKAAAKAKAKAAAEAKAAVEAPADDDTGALAAKPKWLVPVGVGAVAVVALLLFMFTRGGESKAKEAPPPPPPPVHTVVAAADAATQVAVTPPPAPPVDAAQVVATPPDAAQVAVAPPVDAKVEAAPADAKTEAVATDSHKHHHDDNGDATKPPKDDTKKPPKDDTKPAAETRSIPELFGAGELAKVNKACTTTTRFNAEILKDCGLAACAAKDTALAKRWSNALSGQDRADVIAKCTANGVDLSQ